MENNAYSNDLPKKRGRPRSEKSRKSILSAALKLVEESGCGRHITMEAIARKAGVGKQTVYKWWKSTGDIFLEILRENATKEIPISGLSPQNALEEFLVNTFSALNPTIQSILKSMIVEAIFNAEFKEKLINELILSRRKDLMHILNISDPLLINDKALLVDFVFGLMWYRLLTGLGSLDEQEATKIANALRNLG